MPEAAASKTVTIVVPCLDEEQCIGEFVDWCKHGLASAGVQGEILIVDSSSDRSPVIAEERGARVLRVPRRGLGRAYIDAVPHIQGDYVIMGDCDLTYDFRELKPLVEKLDAGADFVMGSRFRGHIQDGAMPALHRYFGTPLTTWILNSMYGSKYSDIHCGMRALTRDALLRMDLQSQSWEYASEMVIKAAKMGFKIDEVPVSFFKDREGRQSHHKRSGWFSPWRAGWLNLKAMFLYAPDFFLNVPGAIMLMLGLLLTLALAGGPREFVGIGLNLHWMLLGMTLATLGYTALVMGLLARIYYDFDAKTRERWKHIVTYDRGVLSGFALMAAGIVLNSVLLYSWLRAGRRLDEVSHPAIFGLLLIILGFLTFTFTLLLQIIAQGRGKRQEGSG